MKYYISKSAIYSTTRVCYQSCFSLPHLDYYPKVGEAAHDDYFHFLSWYKVIFAC